MLPDTAQAAGNMHPEQYRHPDWFTHREWLERLYRYAGFTDIEFNPSKSINCQARSCALFVSLMKNDLLQQAVVSPQAFTELISHYNYH
jgi:hypothetical protein